MYRHGTISPPTRSSRMPSTSRGCCDRRLRRSPAPTRWPSFRLSNEPGPPARPPAPLRILPFERARRYKRLPVSVLSLWKHMHCFLCTPLVRTSHARAALGAFFDWARNDAKGAALVDFQFITGDGPFQQLMVDYLHEHHNLHVVSEAFNRALLRKCETAEAFLSGALSTGYRKEMRRLRKRLGESGRLESRLLTSEEDLEHWLEPVLGAGGERLEGASRREFRHRFTSKREDVFSARRHAPLCSADGLQSPGLSSTDARLP